MLDGGPARRTATAMTLAAGVHLGCYEVLAPLGSGAMGEVYRARDARLGREVAIKILPEGVEDNGARLARFEREARLLASLNHPNIATVYGLEEHQRRRILVMELVQGETLADLIGRGPIALADALPLALQITRGLEAAHEHAVIHRDLKPANLMLTAQGRIKILDFGLARTWQGTRAGVDVTDPLSLPPRITNAGELLGTVAYMSPEQARGADVDTRTDIWSFGCVLFEMLSGRPPFAGDAVGEVLAAVLRDEPDWRDLPVNLPQAVHRLLHRCLRRDPAERLHHIGDARLELEDIDDAEGRDPIRRVGGAHQETAIVERSWPLTTDVCRHLKRETLDPAIIGDELSWLDNGRASDVLVVYLPGFGFDHNTFREVLGRSPYRGITVTPYGFEPVRRRRPAVPFGDRLTMLRLFLESVLQGTKARWRILTGFSVGADVAMRLCAEGGIDRRHIDGILALGPNVNLETCFVSRRVADIPDDSEAGFLDVAREIAAMMETPQAWLQMNPYLVELVRKYHADFDALRSYGRDVVAPFRGGGESAFAGWYRAAKEAELELRVVFAGADISEQTGLREVRLAQVDRQVLGPRFRDADLVSEPDAHHMGLMDADVIAHHVEVLLAQVRRAASSSGS